MEVGMITIRPMAVDDLPMVVQMESSHQPKPWTVGVFESELAAEGRVYLVADNGNRTVGFGGVMIVDDEAHVTNLFVDPEYRSSGIGRWLMADLIGSAIEAGARHLTLEVRSNNRAAIRLYSKLGLAPVGIRPKYYDDDDALIMWAHDIASVHDVEVVFGRRRTEGESSE